MLSRFFGRSVRLAPLAAALSIALSIPLSAIAAAAPPPLKTAASAEPWAGPAFSASPAALLAAARALPPVADQAIDFLWFETRLTLEADGLWTERQHQIYRVLDASEVDDWAYVEQGWSPWHQLKPELRARVIGLDGTERKLDPKTIAEVSSGEDSTILFDDGKALRAPLPAVEVGVIVEIETFVRDQRPLFSAGSVRQLTFPSDRLRRGRVEMDVAAAAPLHWVRRLLPEGGPVERTSNGRRVLTFEWRDLVLKNDLVPGLPPETPWYPYLAFSSAARWQRVAAQSSALVDRAVAGADVRAAVEAASQGATDQTQVIDRLLAYLQAQVRYTGVEFGDAGIVPRSPAETLARRFGDCKDKSTLLVALLRAADIPAYLALLSGGWGSDVDPELPGLGAFNHAIVYVPASPPIWIDATEELARAGELPASDRDRWVLVAAPGTQALQKTPAPTAAENLLSRTRTVTLAELGKAKIVEDVVYRGDLEIQARRSLGLADEKSQKEQLKSYAESELLTDSIGPYRMAAAKDLSRPFATRLEIPASPRGASDLNEAAVGIRLESLLERMPYVFLRASDDDEAEEEEAVEADEEEADGATPAEGAEDAEASPTAEAEEGPAEAKPVRRKQPFVFRLPFVTEWRYEIHPPAGFAVREIPESRSEALGTATLERRYRSLPGGVIEAYFRFDSGKTRLSPEEYEATREKTLALAQGEPVLIYFDQVGAAALNQGKVAEALAEFRRLAAQYPDHGLYPLQISRALLAGGLQEAAKAEAERAVALSPKLADAHQNLGWVLQHDALGRLRGKGGFDRAGAVAAYKKAVALDPDNDIARADYAILLEFDEAGRQYGPKADLETSGTLFRELHDKGITGLDVNLMHNLLVRGKLDELKKFTNKTDASAAHQKYLAAVQALVDGPDAAARLVRGVADRDQKVAMLTFAGQQLLHKRRYAEAGKLFEILASVAPNAANSLGMTQWIASVRPWEEQEVPGRAPATLLHRMMYLSLQKQLSSAEFKDHLSKQLLPVEIDEEVKAFESRSFLDTLSGKANGDPEALQLGIDIAMSLLRSEVIGDDDLGYRVKIRFEAISPDPTLSLFVLREDGEYRVLGDNTEWAPVGRRILDLAAAGRLDEARQWLDWARDSIDAPESVDPYGRRAFARLWTVGQKGDLDAVRAAGTVLLLENGDDDDETLGPVRRAAYEDGMKRIAALRPTADGDVARAFDVATLKTLMDLERWAEALPLAERLSEAEPGSDLALVSVALACRRLGRATEAAPRLEARLAKNPNDLVAARLLAEAAESDGDIARSVALTRALVSRGKGEAHDWNRLAWDQLFEPKIPESALKDASRASELANHANPAILHTLASVYAELERPSEAYRVLLQSIEAGDRKAEPSDWYVFGRMAETYGLADQARTYYRRVEKSESADPVSAFVLAQRRLAGLGPEKGKREAAKKAKG